MKQRHGTAVSCRHAKETMLDRPHAFFAATPVGSAADKARELRGSLIQCCRSSIVECVKPGVHTNDFAPIYGRRANKLGHASLTTVFRPSRLTLPPILREDLESPVLRYQPIKTAVVTDACLNTRWHHGAYTSAALRGSLGLDRVVTVYVVQSAQ